MGARYISVLSVSSACWATICIWSGDVGWNECSSHWDCLTEKRLEWQQFLDLKLYSACIAHLHKVKVSNLCYAIFLLVLVFLLEKESSLQRILNILVGIGRSKTELRFIWGSTPSNEVNEFEKLIFCSMVWRNWSNFDPSNSDFMPFSVTIQLMWHGTRRIFFGPTLPRDLQTVS